MSLPKKKKITVSHSSDVIKAEQIVKKMATAIGFNNKVINEITLAVKELASNLSRHTTHGTLTLTPLKKRGSVGIKVESVNCESVIADVEKAMSNGFSTAGSLGYGLGSVNRLMDEFDIKSKSGAGKGMRITCKRWIRKETSDVIICPLSTGAVTRARRQRKLNGDAFVIKKWDKSVLVAVIDGVGHGQHAHRAAQRAREYVESHFDQPLKNIFRGVGHNCRGTRGVVMALARFDWERDKLTFASIGNIEVRVFGSSKPARFVIRRGIVGVKAPDPVVTENRWEPRSIMVLHSDGIRADWKWEEFSHLAEKSASAVAQKLIRALGKDDDDATAVVVKGALP